MTQKITTHFGGTTVETEIDEHFFDGLFEDSIEGQRESAIAVIEDWGHDVTKWMQQNASWQDQTGKARRSLGVQNFYGDTEIVSILTGGVAYLEFLELNQAGRFAILAPALDIWAEVLIERLGAERE